jgi:hypothetical protein
MHSVLITYFRAADVCRSRQFSIDGYCALLRDAVRLLRLSAQFEDAIEVL